MRERSATDLCAGAVVVVLAVAAALGAMRFPSSGGAVPGPAMFPLLIAVLWTPFGVSLVISGWRGAAPGAEESSSMRQMWGLLGLTVGYTALLPVLGFISSSALFLVLSIRFLGYRHGWRAGALALSVAFVVHGLFAGLMNVPLPAGWVG